MLYSVRGYYTAARRYEFYFQVVNLYCFSHEKIKFISSSHRVYSVIFVLLYWQIYRSLFLTDCLHCTNNRDKAGTDDVIDILTGEDMEIRHSGPGCRFV